MKGCKLRFRICCAIPAVTEGLGFNGLIRETAPFTSPRANVRGTEDPGCYDTEPRSDPKTAPFVALYGKQKVTTEALG